MLSKKEPFL